MPIASAVLPASRIEGASWFSISYACEILAIEPPLPLPSLVKVGDYDFMVGVHFIYRK